jgi:hypothetical protein
MTSLASRLAVSRATVSRQPLDLLAVATSCREQRLQLMRGGLVARSIQHERDGAPQVVRGPRRSCQTYSATHIPAGQRPHFHLRLSWNLRSEFESSMSVTAPPRI